MTERHPFNRISFITLNQTRLFTAHQVANLIEEWSSTTSAEQVLDMFFGRLENAAREGVNNQYSVVWADVDCLYGELKDELRAERER